MNETLKDVGTFVGNVFIRAAYPEQLYRANIEAQKAEEERNTLPPLIGITLIAGLGLIAYALVNRKAV